MTTELQDKKTYHQGINTIEDSMRQLPTAVVGRELDAMCPLKHTFVDGMYVREIFMPKGSLIMSKIHKWKHPYFIMKGDTSVLTEMGVVRLKAPYSGITERGTKRLLFMHEDTVWITVHATKSTDVDDIEKEIIAETFDDIFNEEQISAFHKEMLEQKEA